MSPFTNLSKKQENSNSVDLNQLINEKKHSYTLYTTRYFTPFIISSEYEPISLREFGSDIFRYNSLRSVIPLNLLKKQENFEKNNIFQNKINFIIK